MGSRKPPSGASKVQQPARQPAPSRGRAKQRSLVSETSASITALRKAGRLEGREAHAELALLLARTLDEGAGLAVAAVAREFRATMAELERVDDGDGDGEDEFVAWMRSEVGDPSES